MHKSANTNFTQKNNYRNTIDYIILNRICNQMYVFQMHMQLDANAYSNVLDISCLTSADVVGNNRLLYEKFRIKMQKHIQRIPKFELRHNINSFKQNSVKDLYKRRLVTKLQQTITEENDVETALKKSENNVTNEGLEVIGKGNRL